MGIPRSTPTFVDAITVVNGSRDTDQCYGLRNEVAIHVRVSYS